MKANRLIYLIYPNVRTDLTIHLGDIHEGLASIAAVLEQEGAEVKFRQILRESQYAEVVDEICQSPPLFVGITMTTMTVDITRKVGRMIKTALPNVPVVVGGIHPTLAPEQTIECPEIDILCVGEGEKPIRALYQKLRSTGDITRIPSLWIKNKGDVHRNPCDPVIERLDELPFPAYHLINVRNLFYTKIGVVVTRLSRGCPFSCSYCANETIRRVYPGNSKYFRFLSPERSIEKLKYQLSFYDKVKLVSFSDDLLVTKKPWLPKFLKMYKREIGVPYVVRARLDTFDEKIAALLKRTGCQYVIFGCESGNERIRFELLNRPMKTSVMMQTTDICRGFGLNFRLLNMIGLPGETPENILETIQLNARMCPTSVRVSIFYPYYGNKLYELCIKKGLYDPNRRLTNQKEETMLMQAQLPYALLHFFRQYFGVLVKLYGWLYKLKMDSVILLWDTMILSGRFPRGFLNRINRLVLTPIHAWYWKLNFCLFGRRKTYGID